MSMSEAVKLALPVVKKWEGLRLKAYRCPAGVWTCGYGETQGVTSTTVWTKEQAEQKLATRLAEFERNVLSACPSLSRYPHRLAACICLAYNIGVAAFKKSSVARSVNNKLWQNAADSFLLWKMAGGKVLQGLVNRRKEERQLFLKDGLK